MTKEFYTDKEVEFDKTTKRMLFLKSVEWCIAYQKGIEQVDTIYKQLSEKAKGIGL